MGAARSAARLAAANGGEMPASYAIPASDAAAAPTSSPPVAPAESPASFEPVFESSFEPSIQSDLAPPGPPTAPPLEYEAEPFDPDALFRDGG